jgi:outer membrane lipoprotein-sorting protein
MLNLNNLGKFFIVSGMNISLNKENKVYADALAKNAGLAKSKFKFCMPENNSFPVCIG